ncbi:DNA gyrase subunit A [Haladaptatus sp. F3-133]|uniref:DNA gyrase subunit A n=1 Tax=Halorutilus salinus TaxID=2487751 RepID=A0A9Q4C7B5_9EURY|nr:DNA gyrase subunit A [Halorutilus salinus]MCX2819744.1 DNA gyrase subunit A [Halorutilus salinus]
MSTEDANTPEGGMYPDVEASNVDNVRVEDEMEQSYIDYAMSVIAGRALPDVRDGLKPVHRRILYSMEYEDITSSSGHRKSSSVVGTAMGNWHPHGDKAIYDALVRMAQDFSMRYPLVDGQGNFGSLDGDPPAAMRYTEARMSPLAEEMLADIDKDTVDWQSSYDDRLNEPEVLPAGFPNLLVNGSSGIAVGMSTNIPPHNLGEVVDAAVELIENPEATVADLMEHVEGPDFPTGGKVVGRNAIAKAYETGRGKLTVRGITELNEDEGRVIITEMPYQVDKADLIEKIADLVGDGKVEGVRDIRDESDRDGVRVVVELKRGASPELVRNRLFEHTRLEKTFGVINLALVDGQPRVLSLREMLDEYLDHRSEVVRRRSAHELDEAEERAHVLEGRLVAIDNAEDVVDLIRGSDSRGDAKTGLRDEYGISERQAEHVVRMQLGSLTSLERDDVEEEHAELEERIERLEEILGDEGELMEVVRDELLEIKDRYADERRTRIEEGGDEVTREDLVPEKRVLVVMTRDGYAKRMEMEEFETQKRGGKGIIGADLKEGDALTSAFVADNHDFLLCFTNHGNAYWLKTYEIPEAGRTARGRSVVNLIDLDDGERVTATLPVDSFDEDRCFVMVTRNGYVKRVCASEFSNPRSTGIIATSLEDGDELVGVELSDGEGCAVVGTRDGMTICFAEGDAREMGRSARGVRAVELEEGDAVADVTTIDLPKGDEHLFTVTSDGYAKRTPLSEYKCQGRAGKGLVDIKTGDDEGRVALDRVKGDEEVVVASEDGQVVRTRVDEVSEIGRNTQGVILMRLEDGDEVADVATFGTSEDEGER